jgi:hypothetical protein
MGAEEMHMAARKIMGRSYRFNYMFLVVANIFSFPTLIFFFHNIRAGWRRWHRSWRKYLIRFGGWVTLRKWTVEFRKDNFPEKLQKARVHLRAAAK